MRWPRTHLIAVAAHELEQPARPPADVAGQVGRAPGCSVETDRARTRAPCGRIGEISPDGDAADGDFAGRADRPVAARDRRYTSARLESDGRSARAAILGRRLGLPVMRGVVELSRAEG
jgi:hypothetical protein